MWPLIGRDGELGQLRLALDERRHAVVGGVPGVGKTRLADEATAGRPTVRVTATAAASGVPFGALAPLLPDQVDSVGVLNALRAAVNRHDTACLFADDAHLLDPASAGLIHQLGLAGVPILATVRTGAPVPDAITALWKSDGGVRVDLTTLSTVEVGVLLERALGGQVDTGAVHRLGVRSGGNPLFLRELVRAALADRVLRQHLGVWTLTGEISFGPRLADVFPTRVRALAPPVRRVVELVALAEPVPLEILAALTDPAGLEAAEEAGLILVTRPGDTTLPVGPSTPVGPPPGHLPVSAHLSLPGHLPLPVRLWHPLYGEAVRASLPASRRLRLYGELARTGRDTSAPTGGEHRVADVVALRLGWWELEAGHHHEPGPLLRLCRLARPLDAGLAERFATAAVAAGGGVPAGLELADLLVHAQRHDEAEAVLGGLDQTTLSLAERATVTVTRALSLSFAPQRPEAALAVLAEAGDLGPAAAPMLDVVRAAALMRAGQVAAAAGIATRLATDEGLAPPVRLQGSFTAIAALSFGGQSVRALAIGTAARALLPASAAAVPEAQATLRLLVGYTQFVDGDLAGEEAMAQAAYAEALTGQRATDGERLQFAQVLGRLALMRGQPHTAVRLLREVHAGGGLWWEATLPWTRALLAESLAVAGERGPAREMITAARDSPCCGVYRVFVAVAAAEVEAADGASSAAIRLVREAADVAGAHGLYWPALLGLHAAVRHGDLTAAAEVEAVGSRVDGALARAMVAFAQGRAGHAGPGLERAADAFAAIGAHWYAAEARAHAVRAYRDAGALGSAALAAERLRAGRADMQPIATTALAGADGLAALTAREAEVARLAAVGLADREIADRLGMSLRTAQTHLARVYAKLGLRNRRELARDLVPPPA